MNSKLKRAEYTAIDNNNDDDHDRSILAESFQAAAPTRQ